MEERQEKILELLNEVGKVLVKELADTFGVTEDSIRKDLSTLESQGKLRRTYGGAVRIADKLQVTAAERRRISAVEAKRKIAAVVAKMISPEDLIFLDNSTISIAVAEILAKKDFPYRIITGMVDVLVMLARNPKIIVTFAGGRLNKSRDGFCDALNLQFLAHFRPDICFVGVVGADIEKNSLTTNDTESGIHKAKILELGKKNYIFAESVKIGTEGNYSFATFEKVDGLITETNLPEKFFTAAEKLNLKIILPNQGE